MFENKNLQPIVEENDTEVEGKVPVGKKDSIESNYDDNEDEKQTEAEDANFIVRLQGKKQLDDLATQNDNQWVFSFRIYTTKEIDVVNTGNMYTESETNTIILY